MACDSTFNEREWCPNAGKRTRFKMMWGKVALLVLSTVSPLFTYAETRIPLDKKIEQLNALLQDLAHYPKQMPAIALGDFNT
jgi:hypothetical protein